MATPTTSTLLDSSNLQIPTSQVVLIYTEWNTEIVNGLREGANKVLASFPQITVIEIKVPGAIEITYAIAQHYRHNKATAYIALGCVIKGETPHFEYVCNSVTQGITQLNMSIESPVIYGVLTVFDETQAYDRLGGKHGHKGEEAAMAALKMIEFKHTLK